MKAFSTLIGVIFLLAFLSIITAGMSFISISELKTQYYVAQSLTIQQYSESCVEEVLRRLRDDLNYSGGSIPINATVSCSATVVGSASQKTIDTTVVFREFQMAVTVEIDVFVVGEAINFRITSWLES